MTSKCVSWVLVAAFSIALCTPAEAQKRDIGLQPGGKPIGGVSTAEAVAIVVTVAVAVAVVITVVVLHESRRDKNMRGCVSSGASGLTITDQKDKQVYALIGNTAGITPGKRMSLKGKKVKSKDTGPTLVWAATKVNKDLGVCQP
jgi:hypothetical protein